MMVSCDVSVWKKCKAGGFFFWNFKNIISILSSLPLWKYFVDWTAFPSLPVQLQFPCFKVLCFPQKQHDPWPYTGVGPSCLFLACISTDRHIPIKKKAPCISQAVSNPETVLSDFLRAQKSKGKSLTQWSGHSCFWVSQWVLVLCLYSTIRGGGWTYLIFFPAT